MENFRKRMVLAIVCAMMAMQAFILQFTTVHAAGSGVVINEIAWGGTIANGNDEWIELYNNSSTEVDLSGWEIADDGGASIYKILSGKIEPRGYFVIEDNEAALSGLADAVIGLSLANTGDSLVLKDSAGAIIDSVNVSGGAWYAGNGTSRSSMERIDPVTSGDLAGNWGTAAASNGVKDSAGNEVSGTPGTINSIFGGEVSEVDLEIVSGDYGASDEINVVAKVKDAEELQAFGMEIVYDPTKISFLLASEGDFLLSSSTNTTFHYALKDGLAGKVVVAGAILGNGNVSGDGELFNLKFEVIEELDSATEITFGSGNFLADTQSDLPAKFNKLVLAAGEEPTTGGVRNLAASPGQERFSIEVSWEAPEAGAEKYLIYRRNPNGEFPKIAETASLSFTDDDSVAGGGNILINVDYTYRVIAVTGGTNGPSVEIQARETRGIIGDNDRNDQIDGRDVRNLARGFGSMFGEENYDLTLDSNYDGFIDGSDLIDIGSTFGDVYHP